MFDIFYIGKNEELLENFPFAQPIEAVEEAKPLTKMYWVVLPNTEVIDYDVFGFRPLAHDQAYAHIWKWTNSTHGGVLLMPREKPQGYKRINYRASKPRFQIIKGELGNFFDENPDEYVWVVDSEYGPLNWGPDYFEEPFNYKFRLDGHPPDHYDGLVLYNRYHEVINSKYVDGMDHDSEYVATDYPVTYLDIKEDIIEQLMRADKDCMASMFWVIDPFVKLSKQFDMDEYKVAPWDQGFVHVFRDHNGQAGSVRLYPKDTFTQNEYTVQQVVNNSFDNLKEIDYSVTSKVTWPVYHFQDGTLEELLGVLDKSSSPYVWTVDSDVDVNHSVIEHGYIPTALTAHKMSVWQRINPYTGKTHSYGGLRLWPTDMDRDYITTDTVKYNRTRLVNYVRSPGATYKPYDVVFISNGEECAERNLATTNLSMSTPAIHVKGVKGIFEAHKEAAKRSSTKMFWVVDADAEIHDEFGFDYIPDQYAQETVHIWHSRNSVTGAEYGYGGVKLFNREQILGLDSWGLDFTTGVSKDIKVMNQVACTTVIDDSDYTIWRSTFRECVKLLVSENLEHFATWDTCEHDMVQKGVQAAREYVKMHKNSAKDLAKINDYGWLEEYYENMG